MLMKTYPLYAVDPSLCEDENAFWDDWHDPPEEEPAPIEQTVPESIPWGPLTDEDIPF